MKQNEREGGVGEGSQKFCKVMKNKNRYVERETETERGGGRERKREREDGMN